METVTFCPACHLKKAEYDPKMGPMGGYRYKNCGHTWHIKSRLT